MARFDKGWIKAPRELFDTDRQYNAFHGDGAMVCIYTCLMAWANYKPGQARFGLKLTTIERGQLLCSVKELSEQLGFSSEVVRRVLRNLEFLDKITIQTNNRGSLVTVLNYDAMQGLEIEDPKQKNKQDTNDPQTANKQDTNDPQLSKEVKKEKREEGKNPNMQNGSIPIEHGDNLPVSVDNPLAVLAPGKTPWTKTEIKAAEKKMLRERTAARTALVWQSYRSAYYAKYGIHPADNARIRAQAADLIGLVGEQDAIEVVDWYVLNEVGGNGWLVEKRHPFGELVKSYQTYWGNLKAGVRITSLEAKRFEASESNRHEINKFLSRKAERENSKGLET